ncbi:peptidase M20/M25/M40 family protein [Cyclobacterium qasimii M12-11B]|uniref:Peptidase M20/M25/M40 family protein n=1 Tax=Cyclobacterium qasimii M12-11B TaxID=641524 RepID=S7V867_9BACT|nr:peptidase M20/M25/M40 family protein [Cyclobacterium qasimii M12-11B]
MLQDVQYLSSDKLAGRATTTEGNELAANYIISRFEELEITSQYPDYIQHFTLSEGTEGRNIIGFIPGTSSSQIILLMAHYDHLGKKDGKIYHGADDNASGTATLLNLAAYFMENKPSHSILFAATDAEEMGLLGAKALLHDFPFPLKQIKLVVNMDMISRSEENTLYAVGTTFYPQFKRYLEKAGKRSPVELVFGNDGGKGELDWTNASDHGPFHKKKFHSFISVWQIMPIITSLLIPSRTSNRHFIYKPVSLY